MHQHFTIKALVYEHRGSGWKTSLLYYGLWNDLTFAMQANRSLVRNTTKYSYEETVFPAYAGVSLSSVSAVP
ncbi:hypothetical protein H257_02930 [Aphanomyces astaci]|nr:hypothetical protein H257_02930 [Aphanomyces astaci]ETV85053.1 hypothetical protein H257_02930 [Aphanomyces astaci]|eukprot:XP_009825071.1 hypothetical protein H257_02930 [Aphanomyces astaci]